MSKLFPYQQRAFDEIIDKFGKHKRLLLQADTGYGKTYTFSYLAKHYVDAGKKAIILCHREELCMQTAETLTNIGIQTQIVTPSTKKIHHITADVYVCMVETIHNRLKKGKFTFNNIGLVISDEAHIRVFEKTYEYFPDSHILGVTATPVSLKRDRFYKCYLCKAEYDDPTVCCSEESEEWSKPFAFSQVYDDIVVGAPIDELIDFGQLVQEISFVKKYADTSILKTDSTGEYTTKSLDTAYSNDDSVFNVLLNYKELCNGKRTIIFNTSTRHNLLVYEKFKEAGLNVRMFDSVNYSQSGSRTELIDWFRNTSDAILLNVNVFTAGFDCKEVEAIIINRATKSLALFLQMVGRGGRASNKIFKDSFILIDGGDNIAEFGEWSKPRDWENIFHNGLGYPRAKRSDVEDIQDCPNCGALFPKAENTCPECGFEIPTPEPKTKVTTESDAILEPIRKIPPPSGKHIYDYTKKNGENISFAFRILQTRIVDMFRYYQVTADTYEKTKQTGELDRKVKKYILKPYFYLIKQDDIQTGSRRTLDYLIKKTKEKIETMYCGR